MTSKAILFNFLNFLISIFSLLNRKFNPTALAVVQLFFYLKRNRNIVIAFIKLCCRYNFGFDIKLIYFIELSCTSNSGEARNT